MVHRRADGRGERGDAEEWGLHTSLLVTAAGMLLSPVLMALSPLARLGRALPAPAP